MKELISIFILISILFSCQLKEKEYYDTGELKKEFYINESGEAEGKVTFYYKEGKIKSEYDFVNGEVNGIGKEYYPDGNLMTKAELIDGLQNGYTKLFYKNGQLKSKEKYIDGIANGIYLSYYESGNLKMKATRLKDTTIFYKEYSKTGKLIDFYRRVDIVPKLDTVTMGENFDVHVKIFGSLEDVKEVMYLNTYIGIEDSEFTPLEGVKQEYEIPIPSVGEGRQLLNIRIVEKDTAYTRLYYDMFVKPKSSS